MRSDRDKVAEICEIKKICEISEICVKNKKIEEPQQRRWLFVELSYRI